MFNTYHSHSLEALARHFAQHAGPGSGNPLDPVWVVVQNNEIKEWLSLAYARTNGISGNFRFVFPSEFLWVLYRSRKAGIPQNLPSDLNAMHWSLYELFCAEPELLESVPSYDMGHDDAWQRFQFAAQLADNFDQYQVYRPRMMEQWLDRRLVTKSRDEKWQSVLWNRLNDQWRSSPKTKELPRRSRAFTELMEWMDEDAFYEGVPNTIHVFGLSHTPAPFMELLDGLSSHIDVQFYQRRSGLSELQTPAGALAAQWNKPAMEQAALLTAGTQNPVTEPDEEENVSLPALKVHSCHDRRREVQVLKNEILHYLDTHPDAGPEDILVMLPDADAYAATIETIFEKEEGEPYVPVSRLKGRQQQSDEYAFGQLLELLSTTFKASSVIDFMSLDAVKEQFSFTQSGLELMENWIIDNKIHWGMGEGVNDAYSWSKGLSQLMSGFILQTGELDVYEGMVPYANISTTEEAEWAAQFSRFLHVLKKASKGIKEARTIHQWLDYARELNRDFFGIRQDDPTQYAVLVQLLDRLKEQAAFLEAKETIPYSIFKSWLNGQLGSHSSSSGRFGQGVTLSSYVPYRAIPYRFIAILGMNESIFPRKAVRPEFDLIYSDPKPGDRILKEDDTLLFLETLEAVSDHLHVSYLGQDQRSDSIRLPSILIQQLLDIIDEKKGEKLTSRHSLHSFNQKYFRKDSSLFSYSAQERDLSEAMERASADKSLGFIDDSFPVSGYEEEGRIALNDLISFFTEPAKYFLRNELDLNEYDEYTEVSDRELFKLKGLDRYKLDDLLMRTMAEEKATDEVFSYARSASLIPEGLLGNKVFDREKESIMALLEQLHEEINSGEERKAELEFPLASKVLHGEIGGLFGDTLVSFRVGSRREEHEVGHWIRHLALLEAGEPVKRSLFISKDKSEIQLLQIHSRHITNNPLQSYLKWYIEKENVLDKLCFFPKSSKAYAEEYRNSQDAYYARKSAQKAWEADRFTFYADSADFYNALIWRGREPVQRPAFHDRALLFWDAFLHAEEAGNDQ